MTNLLSHCPHSDAAYVEHIAKTLLEGAREARLLVSLRFDAKHTRELVKHMLDLQAIIDESHVELDRGVQRAIRALLHRAHELSSVEESMCNASKRSSDG